jgi:four helix bundle protein
MASIRFQDLKVYQLSEVLSDRVWDIASGWGSLARDTVGKQLIRSADSIGANIAEGSGKQTFNENRRYVRIARGSYNEVLHWLRRAYRRKLLTAEETTEIQALVEELGPKLNAYLRSIGTRKTTPTSTTDDQRLMTND